MNEKWDEFQGKLDCSNCSSYPSLRYRGSTLQMKAKKPVKLIVQTSFAEKLKQKGA